ncbi:Conserved_hypothetical protein [Hexamita inflata]|uniref:Uncharacterized protein n=1 Tax=Hexamita inflata TaxID=28002 RepID=A0AA86NUX8_9EUKA|nr:Conserved hypothetical protein [Hexamita inflata]
MTVVDTVNTILSFITDCFIITEVSAVLIMVFVAKIQLRQEDVLYAVALIVMILFVSCSVPLDLCSIGIDSLCYKNPCKFDKGQTFCPTNSSAVCGWNIHWLYYAYKMLISLFIDILVTLRSTKLINLTVTKLFFVLIAVLIHLLLLAATYYFGGNINDELASCKHLLPFQITQIVLSIVPVLVLILIEFQIMLRTRREQLYYVQEEVTQQRDEQFKNVLDPLNILGFDFKTGQAKLKLSSTQVTEVDPLLKSAQKKDQVSKTVLFIPLFSSFTLCFVRIIFAIYMYQLHEYVGLDIAYNIMGLITFSLYPFIISVTPFSPKPTNVSQVLSNPISVKHFYTFLQNHSNPLYITGYRLLMKFKVYSLANCVQLQRLTAKQLLLLIKQLRLNTIYNQIDSELSNYLLKLPDNAFNKLEKSLILDLETTFLRFQGSEEYVEMVDELRQYEQRETVYALLKNKQQRLSMQGVVAISFAEWE